MMTPAGQRWSRERPTAPGEYRWRRYSKYKSYKVDVRNGDNGLEVWWEGDITAYLTDEVVGEWQGPITPHDQEAG